MPCKQLEFKWRSYRIVGGHGNRCRVCGDSRSGPPSMVDTNATDCTDSAWLISTRHPRPCERSQRLDALGCSHQPLDSRPVRCWLMPTDPADSSVINKWIAKSYNSELA